MLRGQLPGTMETLKLGLTIFNYPRQSQVMSEFNVSSKDY